MPLSPRPCRRPTAAPSPVRRRSAAIRSAATFFLSEVAAPSSVHRQPRSRHCSSSSVNPKAVGPRFAVAPPRCRPDLASFHHGRHRARRLLVARSRILLSMAATPSRPLDPPSPLVSLSSTVDHPSSSPPNLHGRQPSPCPCHSPHARATIAPPPIAALLPRLHRPSIPSPSSSPALPLPLQEGATTGSPMAHARATAPLPHHRRLPPSLVRCCPKRRPKLQVEPPEAPPLHCPCRTPARCRHQPIVATTAGHLPSPPSSPSPARHRPKLLPIVPPPLPPPTTMTASIPPLPLSPPFFLSEKPPPFRHCRPKPLSTAGHFPSSPPCLTAIPPTVPPP